MPPQPPEETSVLSHSSAQGSDPRFTIHPKDPLALDSSQNLGFKGHKHGASLSIDHSMMAKQQQHHYAPVNQQQGDQGSPWKDGYHHQRASSHHDMPFPLKTFGTDRASVSFNRMGEDVSGDAMEYHDSNDIGPASAFLGKKGIESYTTSTALGHGLQQRKGALVTPNPSPPGLSDFGEEIPHLPTPSMTPSALMEPSYEPNVPCKGPGLGHYFDPQFSPHHPPQHLYSELQHFPQHQHQHQPVLSSHGYDNILQLYGTHSNMPSPLSTYSPTESFHSAHSSPLLYHREYQSPQSSPVDLVAHYRRPHDAFHDLNATSLRAAPPPYASVAQTYGLKSSPVSIWKKGLWLLFTMGIFLLPYAALKACFHLEITAGAWQTSVTYGMLMTADFLAVIMFSLLNRRQINQRVQKRDPHWVGMTTGILAVGYREDPVLLEGCLKSLRAMRYQRNQRILLVVDGNEAQDEYMAEIFMKVFEKQGATIIRPNFLCMDRAPSSKEREDLVRQIAYHPGPVCVMQPHRGKRSAMYTGFAALLQQGLDAVVVTDSDTYLDPAVCKELAFALAESPIVGAATGDVRIYNTGTWVSFLSSIRYWFAFNLERGAQSYHSVVNCVSGPLGIYRMSIVADVMDNWVQQSFLGVLCTYGDDRHLTNLVLRQGYKVKFSHYAICYTDTPIRFIAWVTQQTRWSKSFFREIPIQLGCIHLHSPWMTYALLYQLIYPMMMVYSLVNCIYFGTGAQISWWMVSITLVGLLKTTYAILITGEKKFFFTTAYGFLYMLGYVPAKIYAALTLYDNSWGTSARLFRNFTQLQNYIAPTTWALILTVGALHNPSRYHQHTPLAEGQTPPMFSDATVVRALVVFSSVYLISYLWFFARTGIITRDYKRDFSYEELFENMTGYTLVDGGKRKVARFEV